MQKILVLAAVLALTSAPNAVAGETHGVTGSVIISASPDVVWDTIKQQRLLDPDLEYSKTISRSGNNAVIEQKFRGIPVWGSTTNVLSERETPNTRVDYQLVRSDKLKRLEGSWVLSPAADGKSTRLSLSTLLDVGIPFTGGLAKKIATRMVNRRLTNVKTLAEQTERKLVESGKRSL